ncbi:MAG: hypothetical protein Q7S40_25250 [Opitutaceae bacterium]|nr:hypothetical protein [Opitutaceae bacterium]
MAKKAMKRDVNQSAAELVAGVTGLEPPTGVYEALLKRVAAKRGADAQKNPAAVALGRLGGLKGGKARAKALSAKERRKIAANAAKKRWDVVKLVRKGYTWREIEKSLGIKMPREKYEATKQQFENLVRTKSAPAGQH